MPALKTLLRLKLKKAKRIAVLGVGSDLRADDAAGMLAADFIQKSFKKKNGRPTLKVFFGFSAPENVTGEIKKFKPTHIIIIDSADMGKKAGAVKLLEPERIANVSFSTHQLPLKIMVDYLIISLSCKVIIIAIQPKTLKFAGSLSKEVKSCAKLISNTLAQTLKEL
ncbi:MAG: hydrogenase maturation peptidase HycI [Candidatus Omnitrophica bacterium]|nr:hydrogenase maturation peptidase HycI [Candidatus Omnitrophota bacterium]